MSRFSHLPLLPSDPILGIPLLFAADQHAKKVNLGIGAYRDEQGLPLVLQSIKEAEAFLMQKQPDKEYLPIEGDPTLLKEGAKLLFGEDTAILTSGELFGTQAIGGSGALRIGGELLSTWLGKRLYLSEETWSNHRQIFDQAGLEIRTYPYRNPQTQQLDFDKLCEAIRLMARNSIILLHAACHNPTGIDPTPEQWRILSTLIQEQELFPLFDLAYQGFGHGIDEDAYAIRYFTQQGHELMVAYSFSKNFGLYNERVGMLFIRSGDKSCLNALTSQVRYLIRINYSTPPAHGARILAIVLSSAELKAQWQYELKGMRERIQGMRITLMAQLKSQGYPSSVPPLMDQTGFFSFIGLTTQQVLRLRAEYGIYMPENGRINFAGLNPSNLDYVVKSILSVF